MREWVSEYLAYVLFDERISCVILLPMILSHVVLALLASPICVASSLKIVTLSESE